MNDDVRISDSELHLLQLLWEDSPQAAADLAARVKGHRGWSLNTVKTLLSRLVAKGAIGAEAEGRRFVYRPLVEREAVAGPQAGRLLDRLFGGRVSPLVAQLAEQRLIEPDDLAELEALIRTLKK